MLLKHSDGSRKERLELQERGELLCLLREELEVFKPVCSLSLYYTGHGIEDFYPILNHLPFLPKPVLFYRTGNLSLCVCIAQTT